MATTTGPLMSMEASGTIGNTLTFARWKGRAYVRTRVIPHNPRSASQTATRAMMRFLTQQWSAVPILDTTWITAAESAKISAFNRYVQVNMRDWTQFLAPSQTFPAVRGSSPGGVTSLTANGGVRIATGNVTQIGNPAAWGIILFADQTPAFTPSRANAALVLPAANGATIAWSLTNLVPGNWYFDARGFYDDGSFGTAVGTVGPITVTAT